MSPHGSDAAAGTARHPLDASDIGIEVASEWRQGRTNAVVVHGNAVTRSRYPGQRVAPAGGGAENARPVLDPNPYRGRAPAGRELYLWNDVERRGIAAYRAPAGEDRSSTYPAL